ncbi:MAG TPA: 3-oxoacyl-[acyl-carrier-protein] reductase [Candidatus Latescibacteria bacterium]|nr:3-oxoacyl-[acyl-carrier-protein] reductase [Candidatus Latescibacterota bacterium]
MKGLKDRVALVTGGARGIGKAIALRLAAEGANIAVSDIDINGAEQTALEIQKTLARESMAIKADVSISEVANRMVRETIEKFGRVDILVNNAGITRDNLLIRMGEAEWEAVISVNLTGTFNCTKAVARQMMKNRYGRVINIASVIGIVGNAGQSNYSASKAGIIGLTKSVAKELAPRGITVNAVAPGYVETEMTKALPEAVRKGFLNLIPLGRAATPEDVAAVVAFLASDDASYITGQVINIDGGMVM